MHLTLGVTGTAKGRTYRLRIWEGALRPYYETWGGMEKEGVMEVSDW